MERTDRPVRMFAIITNHIFKRVRALLAMMPLVSTHGRPDGSIGVREPRALGHASLEMSRSDAANWEHQQRLHERQCFGCIQCWSEKPEKILRKKSEYTAEGGDKVFERGTLGI